jgi:hypothetical protein
MYSHPTVNLFVPVDEPGAEHHYFRSSRGMSGASIAAMVEWPKNVAHTSAVT